ncbi:MAG: adenosylhomocysteinase, partial [Candidatus Omnitrophica bacterium]|nr:adenosylhomocysteinase [Candidatus Omnitrophota bacterium]
MRYDNKDLGLAKKGRLRIEWANEYMRVLSLVRRRFKVERPLLGLNISCCLHV